MSLCFVLAEKISLDSSYESSNDSHEMSRLIFSKKITLLSVAAVVGASKVHMAASFITVNTLSIRIAFYFLPHLS